MRGKRLREMRKRVGGNEWRRAGERLRRLTVAAIRVLLVVRVLVRFSSSC
jgi:hypothetical protein